MAAHEHTSQGGSPPADQASQRPAAAIDVKQLAERVYRLMLEDLRLERARGEHPPRRKAR